MVKRPSEFLLDAFQEKIQRDRKTNEFIYTQSDSFITWIIGFSFAGFVLLIGNLKNPDLLTRTPTKVILVCLLLTIITGCVFRYLSFIQMLKEKNLDDYYFGRFSKHQIMPFQVDEEVKNASFEEIIILLKEDFDETIKYPHELTVEEKAIELPKLKNHYFQRCALAEKDLNFGLDLVAEIVNTTHRIPVEKTRIQFQNEMKKSTIGFDLVKWTITRSVFYTICILSFLITICIAGISLLLMQ